MTIIITIAKDIEAVNIEYVPKFISIYPGLIISNIPIKPKIIAIARCIFILSLRIIIARRVANIGDVNPIADIFSREIKLIAKNQVVIEMQLISDLAMCNFILFVFNIIKFFFNKKGIKITKPKKHRKKEIINECRSIDSNFINVIIAVEHNVVVIIKIITFKIVLLINKFIENYY